MILSTSHISRHLILSVLIILIFLVIVPYKRREILGDAGRPSESFFFIIQSVDTGKHAKQARAAVNEFIVGILCTLVCYINTHKRLSYLLQNLFFHKSKFKMVYNCRAEISPRPVSQDVHLCTTFYLYRLNYVAHTLQLLWTASSQFLSLQTITLPVPTDNTFQIALIYRIYLTWNIATLSTVISRITTPHGSQHHIEYEL